MSGTSLDGIDGALLDTDGEQIKKFGFTSYKKYSDSFRQKLKKAIVSKIYGQELEKEIAHYHYEVIQELIVKSGINPDIIGFHGQTVFHCPELKYSIQIGDAKYLAELCQIPIIYNFRKNDLDHGGQGAPLIPVFHKALVQDDVKPILFINVGGVSNLTFIGKEDELFATDIGPGNALIDDWVYKKSDGLYRFDQNGKIAKSGRISKEIIDIFLHNPFFEKKFPQSLDRNHFHYILNLIEKFSLEDGAATLTALTRIIIQKNIELFQPEKVYLSGGGARNQEIFKKIVAKKLVNCNSLQENFGDFVEAYGFAFLAVRSLKQLPITFPTTTGVPKPVSGGIKEIPVQLRYHTR